ncbi:ABC transporter substrate-binding protein [Mesorhizobium sp. LHD-90]|uniref:ABC transporter substrate-binding protein n=1 Tax=Mesorhizobium sp. LHD-90 TaxID=3071414 RepID=UPI0027E041BC|nr:ABC transporter substrate-binding protein [Mesorhizobium sp. LHD-90]MDQ6433187.1 ABC transporter substrate-binding protein [Mesorhizobium sp. LHD-90]
MRDFKPEMSIRILCTVLSLLLLPVANVRAQTLTDVSIALPSTSVVGGSIRLADVMGMFEKHGLKPKFTVMDGGAVTLSALVSGSVDAAMLGGTENAVARSRGQDVVILANTYGGFGATLVLDRAVADASGVAPDAPLQQRLKALSGLTLAAPSPTSDYTFAFKSAAAGQGAAPNFVFMSQSAMPAALQSGAVQGYVASAPNWGAQVLSGTAVVWISGPKRELPPEFSPRSSISLQMMRATADGKPEITGSLIAVVDEMIAAMTNRPDDVIAALGKLYPALSAEELKLLFGSESGPWAANRLTVEDVQADLEFALRTGVLSSLEGIDARQMLHP